MATYLDAKKTGFTGSYDDWVKAGRPGGSAPSTATAAPAPSPTVSTPTQTTTTTATPITQAPTSSAGRWINGKWFPAATSTGTDQTQQYISQAKSGLQNIATGQEALKAAGFTDVSQGNLANIQQQINTMTPNAGESDQDFQLRKAKLQEELSNLSKSFTSTAQAKEGAVAGMTAGERASSGLEQRGGYNQSIAKAVFQTKDQNYIQNWLNTLNPQEKQQALSDLSSAKNSNLLAEAGFSVVGTKSQRFGADSTTPYAETQNLDLVVSSTPVPGGLGMRQNVFGEAITGPSDPGPDASPAAAAAYARALKIYEENVKIAQERTKAIKMRVGSEINMGAELDKLRQQNKAYSAKLNSELGLEGVDEQMEKLEGQYGLLVDRTNTDLRNRLKENYDALQSGFLTQDEYNARLDNLVLTSGTPYDQITGGTGTTPEATPPVDTTGTTGTEGTGAAPEPTTTLPSGAITDNTTGTTTWTNSDTGMTFTKTNGGGIDLSKMRPEDLSKLDGIALLYAEMQMTQNQADKQADKEDAWYKYMATLMSDSAKSSQGFVERLANVADETARIEKQKAMDDITYQKTINDISKAETFDEIADAQAKSEGYYKGLLSAYGAGESSAALAIMSANNLKFAKLKANTSAKFNAEDVKLMNMMNTTQAAYTNSIVEIQTKAASNITDISNNLNQSLGNLMGQKLRSDGEKERDALQLKIGFIKGVKEIEANRERAKLEAQKEATKFMMDKIDAISKMSAVTGTVWKWTDDGQLVDTGVQSFAGRKEMFDQYIQGANLAVSQGNLMLNAAGKLVDAQSEAQKNWFSGDWDGIISGLSSMAGMSTNWSNVPVSGYNFGDKTFVQSDNQRLANGQVGTPGIDIGVPENTPVVAPEDGYLTVSPATGGPAGLMATLRTTDGKEYSFLHLNSAIKPGPISKGTQLGLSGGAQGNPNAGASTGAHLDYRVKVNGQWQDPKNFPVPLAGAGQFDATDSVAKARANAQAEVDETYNRILKGSYDKYGNLSEQGRAFQNFKNLYEKNLPANLESEKDPVKKFVGITNAREIVMDEFKRGNWTTDAQMNGLMQAFDKYTMAAQKEAELALTKDPTSMAQALLSAGRGRKQLEANMKKIVDGGLAKKEDFDKALKMANKKNNNKVVSANKRIETLSKNLQKEKDTLAKQSQSFLTTPRGMQEKMKYDSNIAWYQNELQKEQDNLTSFIESLFKDVAKVETTPGPSLNFKQFNPYQS